MQGQNCAQEISCLPTEGIGLRTLTSLQGGLGACLQGDVSSSPEANRQASFLGFLQSKRLLQSAKQRKLLYGFIDPSSAQIDFAVADLRRHGSSNL